MDKELVTIQQLLAFWNMNYHPQAFHSNHSITKLALYKPNLPPLNYTSFATNFTSKLRSLACAGFPTNNMPQKVDKQFFFTVGLIQTNVLKTKSVRDQMEQCLQLQ
jgi:hypothetical protein